MRVVCITIIPDGHVTSYFFNFELRILLPLFVFRVRRLRLETPHSTFPS